MKKPPPNKHGLVNTGAWKSWANMKKRCLDEKHAAYKYYGGRGISFCERWVCFLNFYADMGQRPDNCSLDRIDPNKGYYRENCRWLPSKFNQQNMRSTVMLTLNGITDSQSGWARRLGISVASISLRRKAGKSIEEILSKTK